MWKPAAKRFQQFVQHLSTLLNDVEVRDGQTHSTYSTVGKININTEHMLDKNLNMFKFFTTSLNNIEKRSTSFQHG